MSPLLFAQKRAKKAQALACAQKALTYRGNLYCPEFVNKKASHGEATYRGVRYVF